MRKRRDSANPLEQRTTLTLPADSLLNRSRPAPERSGEILNVYKEAFTGFSDEEMLLLDGVVLEPLTKDR